MNRLILIFAIGILLGSCQKSNERLVESEFKNYINSNFDNPKSLKEIVSIEASDTVSMALVASCLKQAITLSNDIDSLKSEDDSIKKVIMTRLAVETRLYISRFSYSDRLEAQRHLIQVMSCVDSDISFIGKREFLLHKTKQLLDSMTYESPKYGYRVKFRQTVDNELKLKTYKAYIDSATRKVFIKTNEWQLDDEDSSQQMKEMEQAVIEFTSLNKERLNNMEKARNHLSEVQSIINRY